MEGYGRMEEAQISVPLVGIEPPAPCVRGGALDRSATRITKAATKVWHFFQIDEKFYPGSTSDFPYACIESL